MPTSATMKATRIAIVLVENSGMVADQSVIEEASFHAIEWVNRDPLTRMTTSVDEIIGRVGQLYGYYFGD